MFATPQISVCVSPLTILLSIIIVISKITTTTAEHYGDACQGIVHPESAIYIRYRNYFDSVAAAHAPDKDYNGDLHCKNIWIWGTTGMGKSAFVRDAAKSEGVAVYPKMRDKWWDGYEGQKYVLMDELMKHPPWELLELIKQWGDRYSFLAWRSVPNDVSATHQTIMLKSTLSRNLNSGDSVVCWFSFLAYGGSDVMVSVSGRATAVVRNN